MVSKSLFFGILYDSFCKEALSRLDSRLKDLFIQSDRQGEYLQLIAEDGQEFLGKHLDAITDFCDLEMLEAHIRSVIRKLVPNYPNENMVFWVLSPVRQEAF